MPRRVDVGPARTRHGDPEGMANRPVPGLVVARKARKDRQPGGVGGGPAPWSQVVGAQVPDGARSGAPASAAVDRIGGVELVETAAAAVDDQDMPVAVRATPALDPHVARDRVAAPVGLIRVGEADRHPSLAPRDDVVRDPDRCPLIEAGAEVGVQVRRQADAADDLRRAWVRGQPVHPPVPLICAREDRAARRPRKRPAAGRLDAGGHPAERGCKPQGDRGSRHLHDRHRQLRRPAGPIPTSAGQAPVRPSTRRFASSAVPTPRGVAPAQRRV